MKILGIFLVSLPFLFLAHMCLRDEVFVEVFGMTFLIVGCLSLGIFLIYK